jgi:hypothetical protein
LKFALPKKAGGPWCNDDALLRCTQLENAPIENNNSPRTVNKAAAPWWNHDVRIAQACRNDGLMQLAVRDMCNVGHKGRTRCEVIE